MRSGGTPNRFRRSGQNQEGVERRFLDVELTVVPLIASTPKFRRASEGQVRLPLLGARIHASRRRANG